jgi:hypothetical protein
MFPFVLLTDDAPIGQIPVGSVSDTAEGTASAGIEFEADGDVFTHTFSDGATNVGTWLIPAALASLCTIRADIVSGSLDESSSATGTDLAMTTDRRWGVFDPGGTGGVGAVLAVTIKFQGVTIASRNVTLAATATE